MPPWRFFEKPEIRRQVMFRRFIACAMVLGTAAAGFGQGPWDIARTTIDGKRVAIEYGRPILRGRTIAGLMKQLPPDRIWRAGAGPVTILTTEADLIMGGKKVPAGNYSLYMHCPERGEYALIINRDIGEFSGGPLPKATDDRSNRPHPHSMNYTGEIADKEVARIPLKQKALPKSEVLIYSFEPVNRGALLTIQWGELAWTMEIQPAA
jgi:hypothetical protein